MGDTYFITKIKCAYCGKENNFDNEEKILGLAYTDEFGADFVCKWCKKKNKIVHQFITVKAQKREKRK